MYSIHGFSILKYIFYSLLYYIIFIVFGIA